MEQIELLDDLIKKAFNLVNEIENNISIKLTDEEKEKLNYIYSNVDHIECTLNFLIE